MQTTKNFKYTSEMNELIRAGIISTDYEVTITNHKYESILKPAVDWIYKLRAIQKLNFTLMVYNYKTYGLAINLTIDSRAQSKKLLIPANIKNIRLTLSNAYIDGCEITLQNADSLIYNKQDYSNLVLLAANSRLTPNHKLYKQIEDLGFAYIRSWKTLNNKSNTTLTKHTSKIHELFRHIEPVSLIRLLNTHLKYLNYTDATLDNNFESMKLIYENIWECMRAMLQTTTSISTVENAISNYKVQAKLFTQKLEYYKNIIDSIDRTKTNI